MGVIVLYTGMMLTISSIKRYTKHGEMISVPDVRGLTLDQVERYLENKTLGYYVLDSAYTADLPPSAVIDQDPAPLDKVKENRTIYLTVNAEVPPKIKMPDLIDKSLRQASNEMESWGLKVGKLSYKPDFAKNAVLKQKVDGEEIEAGAMVSKNTEIDLVLGDGLGSTRVDVPIMVGLTLEEAKFVLVASYLNMGVVDFDSTVVDSSTAMIFMQFPDQNDANTVQLNMGESIDLFLTQELTGLAEEDSTQF